MSVTDDILNQLLYRNEGVDLDFKQAQYRFTKAEDNEKSELLKDILAIANSWRDGTGYILIGFKDCTPHPAEVVGIAAEDHIDDSRLQQFVNSKVEPALDFKYEERIFEGKHIAVISIPKQQRPFFVAAKYGKVNSNIVYVRRGSSTDEATPIEIGRMVQPVSAPSMGQIYVELLDHKDAPQGSPQNLHFIKVGQLPDFTREVIRERFAPVVLQPSVNSDYFRDLAAYLAAVNGSLNLKLRVLNQSNFSLKDFKVEVRVSTPDVKYKFIPKSLFPKPPSQDLFVGDIFKSNGSENPQAIQTEKRGSQQICFARSASLLPGEEFLSDPFLLRLQNACDLSIEVRVLAEQLGTPIVMTYDFSVSGSQKIYDEVSLLQFTGNGLGK